MTGLVDSFMAVYESRYPSYSQALKRAVQTLNQGTGRDEEYVSLRDRLGAWRRGSVHIPDDVQEVMRGVVIQSWDGVFDRDGLLEAIALPELSASRLSRLRNKPLASAAIQS